MRSKDVVIVPMNVGLMFKTIRVKLGLKQIDLAVALGCASSFISKMELKGVNLPKDKYVILKDVLKVTNVPFLDFEIEEYEEDLRDWKNCAYTGDNKKAAELQPGLARRGMLSKNTYLMTQYELACAYYYFAMNKTDELNRIMSLLKKKEDALIDIQRFSYYYICGMRDLRASRYKIALISYLKAEKAGNRSPWDERKKIPYEGLYIGIASCLTFTQHAAIAEEYLKKFEDEASERYRYTSMPFSNVLHIRNLITLSKYDEAMEAVKIRMLEEKQAGNANQATIGMLHRLQGGIYHKTREYGNAINEYEASLVYTKRDSEIYCYTLYLKALAYHADGKIHEGNINIEEGLSKINDETNTEVLLKALKHSMNLKDPSSLNYMEKEAIPKLIEYGDHILAADYCEKLHVFFCEISKYKHAVHYCNKALTIHKKLREGDLSL